MDFKTFTNVLATAQLNFMRTIMQSVPEKHLLEMKQLLFDEYNEAASNLLAAFAPEIDLRPDLTEEALRESELNFLDQIIEKKNELSTM